MTGTQPTETKGWAVITGGAQRLGKALAENLHAQGYNIALHYGQSETEAKTLQYKFNSTRENSSRLFQANLNNHQQVLKLANEINSQCDTLKILINNASSFFATPIGEITEDDWNNLMGSNLKAPLFLTQALAQNLRLNQGRVINIADIHGQRPMRDHTVYCLAKAGNIMLTQSLAMELGPEICVNGIAPGSILPPVGNTDWTQEKKDVVASRTALATMGSSQAIIEAVNYLCLGQYITGQIINVDGGRSLFQ